MRIIYAPEGKEPRFYEFDTEALTGPEAELVEDAGGLKWETYGQWVFQFYRGGWRAAKVGLWVCQLRENPKIGFEEYANLTPAELGLDFSESEAEQGKAGKGADDTEPDDSPTGSASPTPDSEPSTSS